MPKVAARRRHVLVSEGETAELVCDVDGIPQPQLTWHRDEILVRIASLYTASCCIHSSNFSNFLSKFSEILIRPLT